VVVSSQSPVDVVRPPHGPGAQAGDVVGGEAVAGEFVVVVPLGASEAVAEVVEAEFVAAVALPEVFEIGGGVVVGGGVDVDEVTYRAAVGQGADLGADDVVEGEDRPVLGLSRRRLQVFLEDVDLALLTGGGVGGHQAGGERVRADDGDAPTVPGEALLKVVGDVGHGGGVLGGDVDVLAEAVDQAVGLDGVATGDDQRVGGADGQDVGEEPAV
jgi:hypothetical protein